MTKFITYIPEDWKGRVCIDVSDHIDHEGGSTVTPYRDRLQKGFYDPKKQKAKAQPAPAKKDDSKAKS